MRAGRRCGGADHCEFSFTRAIETNPRTAVLRGTTGWQEQELNARIAPEADLASAAITAEAPVSANVNYWFWAPSRLRISSKAQYGGQRFEPPREFQADEDTLGLLNWRGPRTGWVR